MSDLRVLSKEIMDSCNPGPLKHQQKFFIIHSLMVSRDVRQISSASTGGMSVLI